MDSEQALAFSGKLGNFSSVYMSSLILLNTNLCAILKQASLPKHSGWESQVRSNLSNSSFNPFPLLPVDKCSVNRTPGRGFISYQTGHSGH